MPNSNVIALAPALARRRYALGRIMAGTSLLSWDNHFPRGIDDLWTGPFVPAGSGIVIPLLLN
jgi:hypothetical protein